MKRLLLLFATTLILIPTMGFSAQSAQARLHCRSLRVQRGHAVDTTGFSWTMDMTKLQAGVNNELSPNFFLNSAYSNATYVKLYSELLDQTFLGTFLVDIPNTGDANGNGFIDFFEVAQPVAAITSAGAYNINGFGGGNFTAHWSRDAGSAAGLLFYSIPNPSGGTLDFTHAFEVIEYDGQLSYTPAATNVPGILSLTETNSGNTLQGPVTFVKSATNRFNQLTLQTVSATNAAAQMFTLFTSTTFLRRTAYPTNYFGPVEFNDGDPNTADEDYYSWWLAVNDPNDSDHDSIPDFSDDPAYALPRRPVLTLTRGTNNLLLKISGDVGHVHYILETTNLVAGNWKTNLSLTLTNDPQTVSLAIPPVGPKFWRARAE